MHDHYGANTDELNADSELSVGFHTQSSVRFLLTPLYVDDIVIVGKTDRLHNFLGIFRNYLK